MEVGRNDKRLMDVLILNALRRYSGVGLMVSVFRDMDFVCGEQSTHCFGEDLVVHASGFCFGFERKQSWRVGVAALVAEGASLSVEPVKELHFGVGGELLAAPPTPRGQAAARSIVPFNLVEILGHRHLCAHEITPSLSLSKLLKWPAAGRTTFRVVCSPPLKVKTHAVAGAGGGHLDRCGTQSNLTSSRARGHGGGPLSGELPGVDGALVWVALAAEAQRRYSLNLRAEVVRRKVSLRAATIPGSLVDLQVQVHRDSTRLRAVVRRNLGVPRGLGRKWNCWPCML